MGSQQTQPVKDPIYKKLNGDERMEYLCENKKAVWDLYQSCNLAAIFIANHKKVKMKTLHARR